MNIIKTFFAVIVPMGILDAIWLMAIAKPFYAKHLGFIMTKNPVWSAVVLFYILYAIGVAYFVVAPAVAGSIPWWNTLLRGALFGLVAYAAYDLTNQATLANWPAIVTIIDLIWGAVITAITSLIAYLILK